MCFYPTSCCTAQFTAFPWRGPGGQVHDQPPQYTVCWLLLCDASLDGHNFVQSMGNHPPFPTSNKAESSSPELEIMHFFRDSSIFLPLLKTSLHLVFSGQLKVSAEQPCPSQGRRLKASHSCAQLLPVRTGMEGQQRERKLKLKC